MLNARSDEILLRGCVQSAARCNYQIYIAQTLIPAWLCPIYVKKLYFSILLRWLNLKLGKFSNLVDFHRAIDPANFLVPYDIDHVVGYCHPGPGEVFTVKHLLALFLGNLNVM